MIAAVAVPLTPVQVLILAAIRGFITQHGYAPTLRELAALTGRGVSTVGYQVQQLEVKGRLRRVPGQARALVLVGPAGGGV